MTLKYKLLMVCVASVLLAMLGLELQAQNTNSRVSTPMKKTKALVLQGTNPIVTTMGIDTTAPGTTNHVAETNEVKEAVAPGDTFTNSVDMVLLQVPGSMWAGKYDVTQKEYREVMSSNPSAFSGNNNPVDSVTYADAVEFCRKLTEKDIKEKKLPKGYYYTLPTEDEWAGLVADAPLSTAVTSLDGNSRSGTSPVGSLAPNGLGLYDTRGNVYEFVRSDESQPYRILKGGSWADFVDVNLRPQFRWYCKPDDAMNTFGFRCVLKKG